MYHCRFHKTDQENLYRQPQPNCKFARLRFIVITFLFEPNSFISFTNIFIQNIISQGLARIAVPLFFIISAFFLFQNFTISSYKNKLSKRVYTLLIPYLFWATLTVLIYFVLQSIPGVSKFFNAFTISFFTFPLILGSFICCVNPCFFTTNN